MPQSVLTPYPFKKGQLYSNVVSTGGLNTTETTIAGGNASPLIGGGMTVGETYKITLVGTCTSSVANTSTFNVYVGTNGSKSDTKILTATTAAAATTGTSIAFWVEIDFTVRTTGSGTSATVAGQFTLVNSGTTGLSTTATQVIAMTASGFNSTTSNYLTVTYLSAASTTTSTFANCVIERLF